MHSSVSRFPGIGDIYVSWKEIRRRMIREGP